MSTGTSQQTNRQQEVAQLTLEGMGPLGDTYASYNGQTVNVFGGIPGEVVLARIIRYRRRRKEMVSAIVKEVIEASPHRIAAPCPYFGPCSGCQWQHVDYSHQLELKRQAVEGQLRLYPELQGIEVSPALASPDTFTYRNHARFTVRRGGELGYVNRITRRFVKIDHCMIMAPQINGMLRKLQGKCGETTQLSIRYGVNTGEYLVQPHLRSAEIDLPTGQAHYHEKLLGRTFRVASPSFFQVNTRQAERMAGLVRDALKLTGEETLVDAYAGVGTFAVLLAPHARRVIAIEESPSAIRDAATNAEGLDNVELLQGKTEHVLGVLEHRADAVILDPPRAGCHPYTLSALAQHAPGRVAYISCDPEALARDLSILVGGGFEVTSVQPVDMFPQTYHVECIAALEYKGRAAQANVVE